VNNSGFDNVNPQFYAGFETGASVVIGVFILVMLMALVYVVGKENAKQQAAKDAEAAARAYEARIAVAGLKGAGHGELRAHLNQLSRNHLQDVANLTRQG
jgi:hypothetical protein